MGKIALHETGALLSKVETMNMSRNFKIFHKGELRKTAPKAEYV